MATIITRTDKGSPLTTAEMDSNLNNLNNNKVEQDSATGAATLPVGSTAARPTGENGKVRFNTDLLNYEVYNVDNWYTLLDTSSNFGGDVSGTYNAIVVGNDSHTHNANNLTGTTLASGVTSSSLTSVGTLSNLTVSGGITDQNVAINGTQTGTIAGTNWDGGWFKIGNSTLGWSFDNNELFNSGDGIIGTLNGNNLSLSPSGITTSTSDIQLSNAQFECVNTNHTAFNIVQTDNIANQNLNCISIDHNISGSQATTGADYHHRGIWIDMDSSATGGDVNDEHRVYGIATDIRCTGDSDLIAGISCDTFAQPSAGQVTACYGGFFRGRADASGTGDVISAYGVYSVGYAAGNSSGSTPNVYGGYFMAEISGGAAAASPAIPNAIGCVGEIQLDATSETPVDITNAICFQAIYDENDTEDDYTVANGYLFWGDYQGTLPTNAWGIYILDDVPNGFGGDLIPITDNTGEVGTTANTWNNGQFTNFTVNSVLSLPDNGIIQLGTGNDMEIRAGPTHGYIDINNGAWLYITDGNSANATRYGFDVDLGHFHADGNIYGYSTSVGSDIKLKKDISVVENAIDKINQLNGVEFTWKKDDTRSAGVIAQDVEKVLPQAVETVNALDEDGHKVVNYSALTSLFVEAIKNLSEQVKSLQEQVDGLTRERSNID